MFSKKTKIDRQGQLIVIEGGRSRTPRGISMLADGCSFEGRMFLQGESRIGGKVDGMVISDGHLTVEESARIKGEISGVSIHLNGIVEGKVTVSDVLHVSPTGQVLGELSAKRLIVEDGGRIEGRILAIDQGGAAAQGPSLVTGLSVSTKNETTKPKSDKSDKAAG